MADSTGTSWGDLKYSVGWWSGGGPAQWAHGTMQHPPEDRTDVGDEGDERTVAGAEDCPPGDHKSLGGDRGEPVRADPRVRQRYGPWRVRVHRGWRRRLTAGRSGAFSVCSHERCRRRSEKYRRGAAMNGCESAPYDSKSYRFLACVSQCRSTSAVGQAPDVAVLEPLTMRRTQNMQLGIGWRP